VAHLDHLAALLRLARVWADDDQDRARALDGLPDVSQVGGPRVGLGPVIAALRLDDDDQDGLAGRGVGDGDDRVGGELGRDDRVQAAITLRD
jgi:hypothetical protein